MHSTTQRLGFLILGQCIIFMTGVIMSEANDNDGSYSRVQKSTYNWAVWCKMALAEVGV